MKLLLLGLVAWAAVAAAAVEVVTTESNEVAQTEKNEVDLIAAPASVNEDLATAKKALEVVRDFINIFNSEIFKESGVKEVAEIISKVFSFVISIINLIQGIGPQESAEMKFMREQFAEVHAKLDSISLQLNDIKELIEWQTTRVMYAKYESAIIATAHLLDKYVTAPENSREEWKRNFLLGYEHNSLAALSLYQAIVEADYAVATNLAAAVVKFTNNHRRYVMNFLLAMQRVIMRGAQVEIAYQKIKYNDQAARVSKEAWDARMEKLLTKMQQVEVGVKSQFPLLWKFDVERIILDFRGLSHHDFSGKMYHFLSDKYDWRNWFSLAYNDVTGFHVHTLSGCDTVHHFRTHGSRNVVVSSADPTTSLFTKGAGTMALDLAQSIGAGTNAVDWVNLIRSKVGDCSTATLVGAVCSGCVPWFAARSDRVAHRMMPNGGYMLTFVFG